MQAEINTCCTTLPRFPKPFTAPHYIILVLSLLLTTTTLHAQVPDWDWVNSHVSKSQTRVTDLTAENNGDNYASGHFKDTLHLLTWPNLLTSNSSSDLDGFLVKRNVNGSERWVLQAKANGDNALLEIAHSSQSGLYVSGYFTDSVTFGGTTTYAPNGGYAVMVSRLTTDGQLKWTITGQTGSRITIGEIQANSAGNLIISGRYEDTLRMAGTNLLPVGPHQNHYLMEIDTSGNVVWARGTGTGNVNQNWRIIGMSLDKHDNIAICGEYTGDSLNFGNTALKNLISTRLESFVATFHADGTFHWAKTMGGQAPIFGGNDDGAYELAHDPQNNLYVTGQGSGMLIYEGDTLHTHLPSSSMPFAWWMKFDSTGQKLWHQTTNDYARTRGTFLEVSPAGVLVAGGWWSGGQMIIETDTLETYVNSTGFFVAGFNPTDGMPLWNETASNMISGSVGGGKIAGIGKVKQLYMGGIVEWRARFGGNYLVEYWPFSAPTYHAYAARLDFWDCPVELDTIITSRTSPICQGQTVNLSVSKPATRYQWSNGATTPTIQVTNPGAYRVTLTKSTNCPIYTAPVIISTIPAPSNFLGTNTGVCIGDSLTLQPSGSFQAYNWSTGDTAGSITISQPGTYTLTVSNSACQGSDSIMISQYNLPTPTLGADTTFCIGSITRLDAGSNYQSYQWSNGSSGRYLQIYQGGQYSVTVTDLNGCQAADTVQLTGLQTTLPDLGADTTYCGAGQLSLKSTTGFSNYRWSTGATTATIPIPRTGVYRVTVTDQQGCELADTVQITVATVPAPTLGPDISICTGSSQILDGGPNNQSYQWSTGTTGRFLTVTQSGQYSVTTTNAFGCQGTDTVQIMVVPNPTLNLGPDTLLCNQGTLILDATRPMTQYQWTTGDTTPTLTITTAGQYGLTIADSINCTASDTITVDTLSSPAATINLDTTLCPIIRFTGQEKGGKTNTWAWNFGTGAAIDSTQNPTFDYTQAGNGLYTITLIQENECGRDTTIQTLNINCLTQTTAPQTQGILSYPNPFHNTLTFQNNSHNPVTISLITLQGKILEIQHLPPHSKRELQTTTLPAAPYLLKTQSTTSTQYKILHKQ